MTLNNFIVFTGFTLINIFVVSALGFTPEALTYSNSSHSNYLQLLSTHFVHHNWSHLFGNISAMWLLLTLFPNDNRVIISAFLICIIMVGAYVVYFEIGTFLGSSALLYCIPGSFLISTISRKKYLLTLLIIFIFIFYTFILTPAKSNPEIFWVPMTAAHVIGFISGVMAQSVAYQLFLRDEADNYGHNTGSSKKASKH